MACILGVTIKANGLPSDVRKALGEAKKRALRGTAEFWFRAMLPAHFFSSARGKYHHEPRNRVYLREIKPRAGEGQGKYVDLQLTGRSRRYITQGARISGTQSKMTVSMRPPPYFTNPFVGSIVDPKDRGIGRGLVKLLTRRVKHISHQPDKPSELTTIAETERSELQTFFGRRFRQLLRGAGINRVTIIKG